MNEDSLPEHLRAHASRIRGGLKLTLDGAGLETRCPLDNGRHTTRARYSLGQLDDLPSEIITAILLSLDLVTLTTFRRVNNRAMELVDSLTEYTKVIKHCPNVLRAILCLGATSFDLKRLHSTLSSSRCAACHDGFGNYLYLITCERVCYPCFTSNVEYFPLELDQVLEYTAVAAPHVKLEDLPRVLSVSGRETGVRIPLFDRLAVLAAVPDPPARAFDPSGDFRRAEPRRFMAVIEAPYFPVRGAGRGGGGASWGYYCVRCRVERGPGHMGCRVKFTRDGFLGHLGSVHDFDVGEV